MRYLFLITGIGLGHAIREHALIKEIKNQDREAKIHIATFGTALNYFKGKFAVTKIHGQNFPDTTFNVSLSKFLFTNLLYPFLFIKNLVKLKVLIRKFSPNVIINDAQPESFYLGRKVVTIYNLDLERLDFKKDFMARNHEKVIRWMYDNSDKIILPRLIQSLKRNKINYVNPILRTTDLKTKQDLMKKLKLEKEPILVSIGGSKFGLSLIENIIKIADKFDEQFIIFGYKLKNKNLIGYEFKANFLEYLKVSKAIITLAGHNTLSEILVFRKPALVFPIANYIEQKQNINLLKEKKLAITATSRQITEDDLVVLIKKLLNEKQQLEKRLKKFNSRGTGAKEAVDIINTVL